MSRSVPPLSPEARALLDQERAPPVQPAVVRQRALSRARAALTADPHLSTPLLARAHGRTWFIATTLTCAAAVAAGGAAYELRAHFAAQASPAARAPEPRSEVHAVAVQPAPARADTKTGTEADGEEEAPRLVAGPHATPSRTVPLFRADATELELRLLRQARAAVAREDFAAALGPIADHTRRFKDGRLAEEREALRVKALAGLGRLDDARRAATAFKVRFPRSVLLPAVSRLAAPGP